MHFRSDSFFIIHAFSLVFFLLIYFTYDLNPYVGLLSYLIMAFNIYCIVSKWMTENRIEVGSKMSLSYFRSAKNQIKDRERREKFNNLKEIVNKVSSNIMGGNNCEMEGKSFWKMSTIKQSQTIEEIKRIKLSDIQSYSNHSQQSTCYKDQGRLSKKLRNFLMSEKEKDEISDTLSNIVQKQYKNQKANIPSSKENKQLILNCIKIINQIIDTKIQNDIDVIMEDVEYIDKFLQRNFSLHFTLENTDKYHITYSQIKELIRIIQVKNIIPHRYVANVALIEIKKEISFVKQRIFRLPNFQLAWNILRVSFGIGHLKKEFPDQSFILVDLQSQGQEAYKTKRHLIRTLEDDRMFYHKYPQVKTRSSSILLFLILFDMIATNKTNSLVKKIKNELQL